MFYITLEKNFNLQCKKRFFKLSGSRQFRNQSFHKVKSGTALLGIVIGTAFLRQHKGGKKDLV